MRKSTTTGPKTELTLLHGTTLSRAREIESDFGFRRVAGGHVWFVFPSNRDIAEFFARRRAQQEGGQAALLLAVVEDLVFQSLRTSGDAAYVGFDEAAHELLRGRRQWVVTAAGIEKLNARWLDMYENC